MTYDPIAAELLQEKADLQSEVAALRKERDELKRVVDACRPAIEQMANTFPNSESAKTALAALKAAGEEA